MRVTLDLLHEFEDAEVLCLFHNCMRQSRHHVYLLALCEQTRWLFINKFPCSDMSTFSSTSLSLSTISTDTGTQLENKSPGAVAVTLDTFFDFLNTRTGLLLWQNRPVLTIVFCLWLDSLGVLASLRDTISWKRVVKDDSVRSCLIKLKSCVLSKIDVNPTHLVLMFLPHFLLVPSKTRCIQVNFIWIFMFLIHWIHRREAVCLLLKFCPPGINPDFMMESKLIAHPMW